MKKILLIEDDSILAEKLAIFIKEANFEVTVANSIAAAEKHLGEPWSLALLDWTLPDGEGIDLIQRFRQTGTKFPLIMLTARATLSDKVVGLKLGAVDYITKPFDPLELLARIQSQLRQFEILSHPAPEDSNQLARCGITMDLKKRVVLYEGNEISLTRKQFELLELFLRHPGQVFCRDELLNKIWGYDAYPTTRTVDNHVAQLRQKFASEMFQTLHGVGYRFNETKK